MGKVSFPSRALPLFDISLVAGKKPLSVTNVIRNSDKALVNQTNEEMQFNYWTPTSVATLKNTQSSVTLKNECKQLRYYFPNEIKNFTHLNEKILRLKQ